MLARCCNTDGHVSAGAARCIVALPGYQRAFDTLGECLTDSSDESSNQRTADMTVGRCAQLCDADSTCVAFDYSGPDKSCYLNKKCDTRDKTDSLTAYRKIPGECPTRLLTVHSHMHIW